MEKQKSIINVAYIAPMSIAAVNGGVRNQALKTISHIGAYGVNALLLSPWDKLEERHFDLVHVFGASPENAGIVKILHGTNTPFVLSPVFFSRRNAAAIRSSITLEKLLRIVGSGIQSDFTIKAEMCRKAAMVLPNTSSESDLIANGFSIPRQNIQKIPNGVDARFAKAEKQLFIEKYGISDFILFAGEAGAPRKNVYRLLKVVSQIDVPLVIIGSFYDDAYGNRCRELAQTNKNVTLIDTLPHDSGLLASAYAAASVFVLPSYYETPGIAALEAALAGAKIVITAHGGTTDYFKEDASYLNPKSEHSIMEAIQSALQKSPNHKLKKRILNEFSWDNVAKKTAEVYKNLIQ